MAVGAGARPVLQKLLIYWDFPQPTTCKIYEEWFKEEKISSVVWTIMLVDGRDQTQMLPMPQAAEMGHLLTATSSRMRPNVTKLISSGTE